MFQVYRRLAKVLLDLTKTQEFRKHPLGRGTVPEDEMINWFNNLSIDNKYYASFLVHVAMSGFTTVGKTRDEIDSEESCQTNKS